MKAQKYAGLMASGARGKGTDAAEKAEIKSMEILHRLQSPAPRPAIPSPRRSGSSLEDATLALQLERDENECRKPLSMEESARLAKRLKALLEPAAKERQREGVIKGNKARANPSSVKVSELGDKPKSRTPTRDTVAKAVGVIAGRRHARAAVGARRERMPQAVEAGRGRVARQKAGSI